MTKKQIEDKYRTACGIKDDYKFTTDEEYLINEIFKTYNKGQLLPIDSVLDNLDFGEVVIGRIEDGFMDIDIDTDTDMCWVTRQISKQQAKELYNYLGSQLEI